MNRKQKTMDGNQAAAHVSYAYSDVAAIYPITPSSAMAEVTDEWSGEGRVNIFGETVKVTEMQSEAGAAGAVHGSLTAGALTTTYTASQGLLLMIPNLYKIAGELLPGVFNVAARSIASHALSIFGDHSDIYACRQTGAAILTSGSVQEVMDLTPVAHLSAIKGRIPFINCFDGFRTSHEMQKIDIWDYEDLKELADFEAIEAFRQHALSPSRGKSMGSAQNPDIFFQAREASNQYYDALPGIVAANMRKINEKLGTDYDLFQYYGDKYADHVIIAMGSVCETIVETIDYLSCQGLKAGLIKVRLYRPFSADHLLKALPDTTKQITVLDRTKEPGALGDPLYLDVVAAIKNSLFCNVILFGGRYGLSSKNTTPAQILAVYQNHEKEHFTVGIRDDVTHLSLEIPSAPRTAPTDVICCKFWGLGGDGTVSANKSSVKIIGNHTPLNVQAYFDYDSKKSRGLTVSHLRFGTSKIHSTYLIEQADFVACHNPVYLHKYEMVQEVKDNGTFLLNCHYQETDLEDYLPGQVKRYIAGHHIRFYIIDAIKIGKEIGLNSKISTILQAAFFRLSDILPLEEAARLMKEAAEISYRKKGDKIVQMNFEAIDRGIREAVKVTVPESWLSADSRKPDADLLPDRQQTLDFVINLQKPITAQKGNTLPVSAFLPYVDGSTPPGSAAHERRNVATDVPVWKPENCIQCNLCSYVCPHAVIRPAALNREEKAKAPENMRFIPMTGLPEYEFAITISATDCTGCGSCAGVCPGKKGNKALVMCPVKQKEEDQQYFDYGKTLPEKKEVIEKFKLTTVRGSQFKQPLMEFSGACAGCGETPYVKLITQLFGSRMYIANATGCSSIWGNSSPSTPYTVDSQGRGPAWSNSLFEDAAEYGYGMLLAQKAIRSRIRETVGFISENCSDQWLAAAAGRWLDTFLLGNDNQDASADLTDALKNYLSTAQDAVMRTHCQKLLPETDHFSKKSFWIVGGDGWAYDIGFGGLDHVLASGEDINILVLDTEVYSNTGGQASKATPMGSTAKFASGGKETGKKDLAGMALSYGYVYVAQIAMGADYNQTIKAITEAENYPGPSLIIAYAPCINHGIRAGGGSSKHEEARAVMSGYWYLFRYHPEWKKLDKGAFILDSKEPKLDYEEFLSGELRYQVLEHMDPDKAARLFAGAAQNARERYAHLKKLEGLYDTRV